MNLKECIIISLLFFTFGCSEKETGIYTDEDGTLIMECPDKLPVGDGPAMEVILIFDSNDTRNYRHYFLGEPLTEALHEGKRVSVTFCHPKHGEIMIAEALGNL